jgi:hypothetical protein
MQSNALFVQENGKQIMRYKFVRVSYDELNSRQKENYNFQKVSAILADYGFLTHRLSDDWQGADFIAQHIDGETFLRVQLKSRLTFNRKYQGKDLYIAFPHNETWYIYPHDELLKVILEQSTIRNTVSWSERGGYSWNSLGRTLLEILEPFRLEKV